MHYRIQHIFLCLSIAVISLFFWTASVWASETQDKNEVQETNNPSLMAPIKSPPNSFTEDISYWIQEIRYELAPVDRDQVTGIHIRPIYVRKDFKVQFDFGFYQNPRNQSWEWGKPDRGSPSEIPNFIDSAVYKSDQLVIEYDTISEKNLGYGLMLYDYYPSMPYRDLEIEIQPHKGMDLVIVEPAEIRSFQPYTLDSCASLEMFRWQNEMDFNDSKWRLGLTVLRENNPIISANYPRQAYSVDLVNNNHTGLRPFLEATRLVDFGDGLMAGLTGRYISVEYQAGVFRTQGRFLPNYFGGFYEDRKRNTVRGSGDPLPDLYSGSYGSRDGYLGRISLNVANFFNFGMLYISDPVINGGTLGIGVVGQLFRFRMNYGFYYYGQSGVSSCQWFVKGSRGIYDYGYRHYVEDQTGRETFFVGVRF